MAVRPWATSRPLFSKVGTVSGPSQRCTRRRHLAWSLQVRSAEKMGGSLAVFLLSVLKGNLASFMPLNQPKKKSQSLLLPSPSFPAPSVSDTRRGKTGPSQDADRELGKLLGHRQALRTGWFTVKGPLFHGYEMTCTPSTPPPLHMPHGNCLECGRAQRGRGAQWS